MMNKFAIGIDTGGTYTDAVIIDARSHAIVAGAKALTTKGNLAVGVGEALRAVIDDAGSEFSVDLVSMVSLSTTLATNALVEGHGSPVGCLLIGFSEDMVARTRIAEAAPDAVIARAAGGHHYTGSELCALDTQAIETALQGRFKELDAFAVASIYSVRNSTHERQAAELITQISGKPVSASCDLADALDGPRRALTATLNARILSLIATLEHAVRDCMRELGIAAPIMMVKGDGSIASAETVLNRPIETILSGPAASVIGARHLSGISDFIISDIGGTTTDVAVVKNGWPKLNEEGSDVGGFRTMVRAIDMKTIGLGGDSAVEFDPAGNVSVLSNRVVPVALLAHRYPNITTSLQLALGQSQGMLGASCYLMHPDGVSVADHTALDRQSVELLERIDPARPSLYRDVVHNAADRSRVPKLIDQGYLKMSGFTPSDAAHILEQQSQWCPQASLLAGELLGRGCGRVSGHETLNDVRKLAEDVLDAVAYKSTRVLLDCLGGKSFAQDDALIDSTASGKHTLNDLNVRLTPSVELIAVGGPAGIVYPEVGRRLGVQAHIPEHSAVANAVGAAVGMTKARVRIEVSRGSKGSYLVHADGDPIRCEDGDQALSLAEKIARQRVQEQSAALWETATTDAAKIDLSVDRIDVPNLDSSNSLIAATISAEVVSEVR